MPYSSVLDVLIGLALLFAAFSLAVSRINEAVLGLANYRGRQLEAELRRLLDGGPPRTPPGPPARDGGAGPAGGVTDELLDGPLRTMRATGRTVAPVAMVDHPPAAAAGPLASVRRARALRLPSYVPSTAFARALLDRVEPPARAMLTQLRPELLPAATPAAARAAYERAFEAAQHSLDPRTAAALHAAMPADHPVGRVLSAALVDATGPTGVVATLDAGLAGLPDSPAKDAMTAAIVHAGGDREKIIAELARWYDEAMDRLSGWYKRRIAVFLLGYAIVLTAVFNLDAIGVARTLWQDGTVRAAVVSASADAVAASPGGAAADAAPGPREATDRAAQAVRDASALSLPIGWVHGDDHRADPREAPATAGDWLLKIAGLLITCLALTAGAPFWFDLLGRLVNMRDTGPKPRPVGA